MNEHLPQPEYHSDEQSLELDGEPPQPELASPATTLRIQIANEQSSLAIDESQIQAAVCLVFRDSPYDAGAVSIAVVDDPTIHELNREYLQHDYPTDVLSFVLEDRPPYLEGELVVSTDTAKTNAAEYSWPAHHELLLYVIHGALHLVGFRDKQPEEIALMRAAESKCLQELGIAIPSDFSRWSSRSTSQDEEQSS